LAIYPGPGRPVFLIGIDGATWKIIDPLIEEGRLPNFKRLIESGTRGEMQSVLPMESPLIWTSIATGKGADKHGIAGWAVEGKPVASTMRKVKALWNILGERGFTVGLNGYLATWPAEEVNGYNFSYRGYFTPDYEGYIKQEQRKTMHPPELLDDYGPFWSWQPHSEENFRQLKRFVNIEINPEYSELPEESPEYTANFLIDKRLLWVYPRDESTLRLAIYLQKKRPVDFTAVYFQGIDFLGHVFWKYTFPEEFSETVNPTEIEMLGKAIPAYYEYIDECLGRLLEVLPDSANIIILSDHGFRQWPTENRAPEHSQYWYLTGNHELESILILHGPDIKKGHRIDDCNVLDITPTILYLFGLPIGEDMDGQVLTEAISKDFIDTNPYLTIPTYENDSDSPESAPRANAADREEIERLRSLGYIR